MTLGLVLDGRGLVRRSQIFEGQVSEGTTLAGMLAAPRGALVVMDAGMATAANLLWGNLESDKKEAEKEKGLENLA